jgi:hypothetical protein
MKQKQLQIFTPITVKEDVKNVQKPGAALFLPADGHDISDAVRCFL